MARVQGRARGNAIHLLQFCQHFTIKLKLCTKYHIKCRCKAEKFIISSSPCNILDWAGAGSAGGLPHAPGQRRGRRGEAARLLREARQLHHRDGATGALQGSV